VLPNSAKHRRRNCTDDFAGVVSADSRHVADSLGHSIVVLAENCGKRGGPLRTLCLRGGFTMDCGRTAGIRVGSHRRSYQRNRCVDGPLCDDRVDAETLAYLLYGRAADLLLNLLLN
jgi:hypothetical protein